MSQSVDVFIDRKVVVLRDTDKIFQAAKAMCENQVGCVIVVDNQTQVAGIVTDRDIVCNSVSNDLDPQTSLKQVMEADIVCLPEEANVDEAISLMKEYGIRRLPIVHALEKGGSKCVGIVTLDDLIAGNFVSSEDLVSIIKSQIVRRKQLGGKKQVHQPKLTQTYSKFISHILDHTDLNSEEVEDATNFILGSIVRRLHYTGGVHFISQLPKIIQETLLDLPAGPDRTVNDSTIVQGISIRTGRDFKTCRVIARQFWTALAEWMKSNETDHVIHQLPEKMKILFVDTAGEEIHPLSAVL